jgi:hypothetical protein
MMSHNNSGELPWNLVMSKKQRRDLSSNQENKIKPLSHFWHGFNKQGNEKWFLELNNGIILSDSNKDYHFWLRKFRLLKK